jgi:hypothetical protein
MLRLRPWDAEVLYWCARRRDSPSYIKACTALEAAMNKEIGA